MLPTIILGGADRRPARLPERGRDKHPLTGFKGVDIRIGDRPLIDIVLERLSASGRFGPIYIAGPAEIYAPFAERATLVDTNRGFGENIRAALEVVAPRHPCRPVAFTTCDVLPDPAELREVMELHDRQSPCDLWFPMIRVPEDRSRLGASEWKPSYRVLPTETEPVVEVLPGHLMIVDPGALRLEFLYRLFQIGYRTRNRSIDHRRGVMVRSLISELLKQDLAHLAHFRVPRLTWTVLRAAIPTARALRDGTVTRPRAEEDVRRIFVRFAHRRRYPERRVLLPIVDALSLALDIDTEEEARAMGGQLGGSPGSRTEADGA